MRLWILQPREVYDLIDFAGVYRYDGERSELITGFAFEKPYR